MAGDQKCLKCGKPATHKITKIIGGKVRDIFVCDEHAKDVSPYLQMTKPDQSKLVELLQHFLKQQESLASGAPKSRGEAGEGLACANCGLTYGAYRKTLLLGCSDCYGAFEPHLLDDLRKIHGATSQHPEQPTESKPIRISTVTDDDTLAETLSAEAATTVKAPRPSLRDLEQAMRRAIEQEEFQEAAQLRDQIRAFKARESRSDSEEE